MPSTRKFLFAAFFVFHANISIAQGISSDNTKVFDGACNKDSHVAEGPLGSDLTERQSRYFCNSIAITKFPNSNNHYLINFVEKRSNTNTAIGFAGSKIGNNQYDINRLYLYGNQKYLAPGDGSCRAYFQKTKITFVCVAKVDEQDRRTVAFVAMDIR